MSSKVSRGDIEERVQGALAGHLSLTRDTATRDPKALWNMFVGFLK